MAGGLELAQADPFSGAVTMLRELARGLSPDAVDQYAQRANGAYPTWKEIQARSEQALAEQQQAGERAMGAMNAPPIDRKLPWLHFAANMLKPTRTGTIAESFGSGLDALATSMGEQNKQELDFGRRSAELGYGVAKDRTAATERMFGLGLNAQQIEQAMMMLRERMMTPAERFALEQGASPSSSDWGRLVDIGRFMQGLTGPQAVWAKNYWANNPKVTAQQLAESASKQQIREELSKDPRFTQGSFASPEAAQQWLNSETEKLYKQQFGTAGGRGPALTPSPSIPAAPPPAAPTPRAGPAALPVAATPGAARDIPPEYQQLPYAQFLTQPPTSQRVPEYMNPVEKDVHLNRVKTQDNAALEQYQKTVAPAADNASEALSAIRAQASILKSDPQMTGAGKEALARIASLFASAGLAPKGWAERVTNWQEFDSFVKKAMLSEQAKQTGVQTEGDAQRIQQALAAMGKTPEANHFILRYLDAASERVLERERFFSQYQELWGTYHGANSRWLRYVRENPLVREVKGQSGNVILFDPEYRQYIKRRDEQRPPQT